MRRREKGEEVRRNECERKRERKKRRKMRKGVTVSQEEGEKDSDASKKKKKKGKCEKSTLSFQEQKLLVKICLRRRSALIFQLISDTLFPPRFRTKCFKLASARRDSPSGDLSSSVNTLKGASAILNYHQQIPLYDKQCSPPANCNSLKPLTI